MTEIRCRRTGTRSLHSFWDGRLGHSKIELFGVNMNNGFCYLKPALVQEFTAWGSDPELSKLLVKLKSQSGELWFDHYVEAMIARYLLRQGCELKVEVPTPSGKSADFKITKSGESFFAHVKHLIMNKVTSKYRDWCYKQFEQFQELKMIPKPLAVRVCLKAALTKRQAAEFVEAAKPFFEKATKEGEECRREFKRRLFE